MEIPFNELQVRTRDQLLEDFYGPQPEQLKLANFVWSVSEGGLAPGSVDSVNGETGTVVLEPDDITATYVFSTTPVIVESLPFLTVASLDGLMPQIALDDSGRPFVFSGLAPAIYMSSGTPTNSTIPLHGIMGRLRVGTPSADTDAATKLYVDTLTTANTDLINSRLSAAQRTAIDALVTGGASTLDDVINALQAT